MCLSGSDIDTLVVAPRDVSREDFFDVFPTVLKRLSAPGAITELTPVPDAFVPIIKLEYSGISIDLIFASVQLAAVPMELRLDDSNILRGLDDRGLRSLNGTRVTDEILNLVPQEKTFRTALRAVKLWAQRRAIYANVMGFPGGVAWAMLVARVCQLYPRATGSVIVGKFFRIMARWAWPQPVVLKQIESGPLHVRVWNPEVYKGDRFHLMPIITPAYPSMCATHNVTLSTKQIILRELDRGGDICDQIFTSRLGWKDLFARHTFFVDGYKYYLSIVSCSRSKEAQSLWSGLVESKVRHLVSDIDYDENVSVAHPFNKGFDRVHRCTSEDEVRAVINGDLRYQAADIKTETTDAAKDPKHAAAAGGDADGMVQPNGAADSDTKGAGEITTLHTTTYYIGLQLSPSEPKHPRCMDPADCVCQLPRNLISPAAPLTSRTCARSGPTSMVTSIPCMWFLPESTRSSSSLSAQLSLRSSPPARRRSSRVVSLIRPTRRRTRAAITRPRRGSWLRERYVSSHRYEQESAVLVMQEWTSDQQHKTRWH